MRAQQIQIPTNGMQHRKWVPGFRQGQGGPTSNPPLLLSGPARCQTGCQDSFSQLSARKPAHCRSLAANEREVGHETAAMVV